MEGILTINVIASNGVDLECAKGHNHHLLKQFTFSHHLPSDHAGTARRSVYTSNVLPNRIGTSIHQWSYQFVNISSIMNSIKFYLVCAIFHMKLARSDAGNLARKNLTNVRTMPDMLCCKGPRGSPIVWSIATWNRGSGSRSTYTLTHSGTEAFVPLSTA